MNTATITACSGDQDLTTTIYKEQISMAEIELIKIQLAKLMRCEPSFVVRWESDQIHDSPLRQD